MGIAAQRGAQLNLRVGIDAITPGNSLGSSAGGMRMYITTLTREMARHDPNVEFIVFESAARPLHELDGLAQVRRISLRAVPQHNAARVMYQNSIYPLQLARGRLDVLFATCNVVPIGCRMPVVVVIQSLQYFAHPDTYGWWRGAYLQAAVRAAVRRAAEIICVSHDSRRAALRYTGGDPARFHVVHHGTPTASTRFQRSDPKDAGEPYILTVTTLYRYKNVERLVEAYACLVRDHAIPHRLRIVGGDADVTGDMLRRLASQHGIGDRVDVIGAVPHESLPAHYAGADLFVYPSLYETFGLPPLEAMALDVPVVASNATAIPEVVGDAAEMVNALDVADLARGMAVALLDSARRQELLRRGRARVQMFTWADAARATLQVLRSAAART
jgi:glycosyltransferase involved in cell wall biosynthesis